MDEVIKETCPICGSSIFEEITKDKAINRIEKAIEGVPLPQVIEEEEKEGK